MIKKPIIFLGTGRSGSTFVSGAIFSHKQLGYPSNYQNKIPKSLSVNLIKNVYDNIFWRIYTRGNKKNLFHKSVFLPSESYNMWDYLTDIDTDFSRDFLLDKKASKDEIIRITKYFDKLLKLQNKKRLAFKLTGPGRIGYLLSIFPDAQFVWVKRGVIPTISSFMKKDFWQSRGKNKLWFHGVYSKEELDYANGLDSHPAELTAFQLGKIISVINKEIEDYKPSIITIDYEDFLENPEGQLKKILDFLNLTNDKACFKYLRYNGIKNNIKDDSDYYDKKTLNYLYNAYQKGLKF